MGNQVLIAIRHDVNKVPAFNEAINHQIYITDRSVKRFEDYDSVVASHYHHASDCVTLAITNQGMHYIPVWVNFSDRENIKAPVERVMRDLRAYRQASIRKLRSTANLTPDDGQCVSLFGYLTDHHSEIPEDAISQMIAEIPNMAKLKNNEIVSVAGLQYELDNASVYKIGTIEAGQTALIELRHNVFYSTAVSSFKREAPSEEHQTERAKELELYAKFAKSLGYSYEEPVKKPA